MQLWNVGLQADPQHGPAGSLGSLWEGSETSGLFLFPAPGKMLVRAQANVKSRPGSHRAQ